MRAERAAVAALHAREIPEGDFSPLGREALEGFAYGALLQDPRYHCDVLTVDGRIAGFVSYSADAKGVLRHGLRRWAPLLSWLIVRAVLRDPRRLRVVVDLARAVLLMRREPLAEVGAEIMVLAVAREFRTPDFYRRTRVNVARSLYLRGATELSALGADRAKLFTRSRNWLVTATLSSLGLRRVAEGADVRADGATDNVLWLWDLTTLDRPGRSTA